MNISKQSIKLPQEKKQNIKKQSLMFRNRASCKIRDLAKFIGVLISSCPAVKYGWLYTKALERENYLALQRANNFEANMDLPDYLKTDILWWEQNILGLYNDIIKNRFKVEIFTDSSLSGWGHAAEQRTYGFWSDQERACHINFLELQAVFYGLKCFASNEKNCCILVRSDNTTAISYVNKMGSIQYPKLNILARQLWQWYESRTIWLVASYISSEDNFEADHESRRVNEDTERALSPDALETIRSTCDHWK
ncbi:hypothetical protein NQ314_000521 [Rhamnusium bicolor]|uniref:RNase H type-1 domain-containing protein n=1 Tax=Rhamnusium bicolor TaxID=1586634 RepID=A0AAV8ZVJ4_9CUCU|nr:hypothetical protein NQ314_000521 [Rhamnusium bicolor]